MILGTVGFIGSGKGTVGNILSTKFGFTPISFAGSLKDAASNIFGWDRNLLEGDTDESREFRENVDEWWSKKLGFEISPRLALQRMGTEGLRNVFHPDIWILSLQKKMKPNVDYVITDVRFPNELEFISELGGKNILIKRGTPEWYETAYNDNLNVEFPRGLMKEKYPDVHYSEWAWVGKINMDWVIDNTYSLEKLNEAVNEMIQHFKIRRSIS